MDRARAGFYLSPVSYLVNIVGPLYLWVLHPWVQPISDKKYLRKKYFNVAGMYCIVKPVMDVSVLNMYTICIAFILA